jgi:hypothetical protein
MGDRSNRDSNAGWIREMVVNRIRVGLRFSWCRTRVGSG